MALVSILNTWIMCTTKDVKKLLISIVGYVLLNIFLFMNGSFAPITFVFATLFLMILYVWIKEKKCPVKLIIAFFAMMPMAFIVDYFPDINKYRTIPIHIQYLQGSYGTVDLGAMMALIFLAIIPVVVFYLTCQKHIIKGVASGAVKG